MGKQFHPVLDFIVILLQIIAPQSFLNDMHHAPLLLSSQNNLRPLSNPSGQGTLMGQAPFCHNSVEHLSCHYEEPSEKCGYGVFTVYAPLMPVLSLCLFIYVQGCREVLRPLAPHLPGLTVVHSHCRSQLCRGAFPATAFSSPSYIHI